VHLLGKDHAVQLDTEGLRGAPPIFDDTVRIVTHV
jgi:hypothetical protein